MQTLRHIAIALLFGLLTTIGSDTYSFSDGNSIDLRATEHLRRPVAIVARGKYVLVGNRQSGTISQIETAGTRVVAEYTVASRIADLASVPQSDALFVLDDQRNQLLRFDPENSCQIVASVPPAAVRIAVSNRRKRVFVNSKWSRQLTAIDLDDDFKLASRSQTIRLPFASHEMLLLDHDRTLLIAEAFGGRIAVIDAATLRLRGTRKLAGHNIRGLAVSDDQRDLLVSHQTLDPARISDYEDLHWGRLVSNAVQVFGVREFIDDEFSKNDKNETTRTTSGWLDQFGGIGGAAADLGAVITSRQGVMAVCLSGTGEVAIRAAGSVRRIPVGRRPSALAIHGERLYVANRFDDSVTVVKLSTGEVLRSLSLGPQPTLSADERGELLFFDAKLSHDGWLSCHSCHTEGHSAGLLVDTLGDGDYGAPKRTPSLLGTADTGPWGWNGSMASLNDQIRKSVITTMHGDPLTQQQVHDLASYLKSLPPPPPPVPQAPVHRRHGQKLFTQLGCVTCHTPPHLTTAATYDVGLADEKGRRKFNPPSLRGVSQRAQLLHDGRAANLKDLLLTFRHQLDRPLDETDAKALLAYLNSL